MQMPVIDKRSAERFAVPLPITLEGEEALVHDLSSTGLMLEAATAPEIGAEVGLKLQYLMDGRDFHLSFRAEVVRVEQHGDKYNIAMRLHEPLFPDAG
jgi:hypothetical protein